LPGDCKPGDRLLIDDGRVSLEVVSVTPTDVVTKVVEGGTLSDHKGINLPGVAVSVPALSEKDIDDLRWALRQGVDMIALSFVRSASDINDVHRIMGEEGIRIPVNAFDAIMVARGDLGVELPLEEVPLVQKEAITLARAAGKPVIVATQMLDSMITASRPTRAEASDVANAVLDGADALMLSGETSVGAHPALTVQTMSRIIEHIESEALQRLPKISDDGSDSTALAMTAAAVDVANHIHAKSLVVFTETGRSVLLVSRHRPANSILAFTPNPRVRNQLALAWGTEVFLVPPVHHTDDMVEQIDRTLLDLGRFARNEHVVVIAGVPPGVPGTTNGMRVHQLGHGAANLD
jgi:pyruvate kinase